MADLPQKTDASDKRRLRQVQQKDLTESRVNDDFVYWLKTKGPNWLLAVLVVLAALSGWNWFHQKKEANRDVAWAELDQATLPEAFAEVASLHGAVDSVALIAWLSAGDSHLQDIQRGSLINVVLPTDGTAPTPPATTPLDEAGRKLAQDAADQYYEKVLSAAVVDTDDVSMLPFRLSALFGKAAVAESRGDVAGASKFYETIEAAAAAPFPKYAEQAKLRRESLSQVTLAVPLPSRATLPTPAPAVPLAPNVSDELIKSLQGAPGAAPATTPPANLPLPSASPTPAPAPAPAPASAPPATQPPTGAPGGG